MGYLMFLKEKCGGKLKGISCANRSNQHSYIDKEDAASSISTTESVLITPENDAHERINVAVFDITGAYFCT